MILNPSKNAENWSASHSILETSHSILENSLVIISWLNVHWRCDQQVHS